jgi:hypothetical protein
MEESMKRAFIIALFGFTYFIISVILFIPLRMKPIPNYNLFFFSLLTIIFFWLFYKACTVTKESNAYVYAMFAGNVLWQVIGELASVRVTEGFIQQFSDVNIKLTGGYIYVLVGWILLFMMWKTQVLKKRICFCFLVFLGIWLMELYLDNYSSLVSIELMPTIANTIAVIFAGVTLWVLYVAKKASTIEKQTVMGGVLYITVSIILVALTQWQKPQTFYLQHERPVIEHEIKKLQEELEYINTLRKQLGINEDVSISEQLGVKEEQKKSLGEKN